MVFRNEFLLNLTAQEHNQIIDGCFCVRCRNMKLTQCLDFGYTNEQLHNLFTRRLLERENNLLDRLFKCTLQEIVHGMAYKISCLQGTRYTYFKAWAKTRPEFTHLSEKEMKKFCLRVNGSSTLVCEPSNLSLTLQWSKSCTDVSIPSTLSAHSCFFYRFSEDRTRLK